MFGPRSSTQEGHRTFFQGIATHEWHESRFQKALVAPLWGEKGIPKDARLPAARVSGASCPDQSGLFLSFPAQLLQVVAQQGTQFPMSFHPSRINLVSFPIRLKALAQAY